MRKIFEYLNYREYISDAFYALQAKDPDLSLRTFCKKAGFASTGTFRFIVTGKRKLSPKSRKKFSRAMLLSAQEEAFFNLLVDFDQEPDMNEKTKVYEKILSFRPYQGARPLEKEQYYYYSSWVIPTIREMVGLEGFQENPELIAKKIMEPTRASDIKAALQMLLNLGLIVRDATTRKLKQADAKVSSPDIVRGICYQAYFRAVSNQALASIERSPTHERELGTMTMTLSKERFEEMKKDLLKFRSEMFEKYGASVAGDDRVYHMNFQLFPLTQSL